ncbi:Voltage-dependent L-type calcium channel subunit alpha-1S [Hondaea fermentalgiana]|uniref:Voltage-dependent L-type calcium channel subunit alpha-1S n=1 Tax=Hondaea fermentalgiana TaxID=2315210 RepID=A0A2R5G299_9STRA|nr:Voltage-dependent L-type calcium channel subunit alpha-1S [Hondaea fermentalgiana]|eukprot:GBG24665.1 Voltage-dependent L-type calcium channel subunit alpha-1S [Hondaea fermentalgiana]
MSDSAIVKVDVTNFTYKCNMYNEFVDENDVTRGSKCCIESDLLVGDMYNKCATPYLKEIQSSAEVLFNILFTFEMAVKIIALGFISQRGTYLRDGWNLLDFVVVFVGWLSYVPGIANLSALRTFRVLRPLRTLSSIPGMRPIVSALIASIRSMLHVMLLCLFLFTVFGIVGLQLFSGTLTGRCYYVDPSGSGTYELGSQFEFMSLVEGDEAPCPLPCASTVDTSTVSFPFSLWTRSGEDCLTLAGPQCYERDPTIIINPDYLPGDDSIIEETVVLPKEMLEGIPDSLPSGASTGFFQSENGTFTQRYKRSLPTLEVTSFCLNTGENQLGDGFANFDTIGYAWLSIMTSITLEGWSDIMYGLQASFGHSFVIFMYFFIMLWMCSFFMLELTLAVINEAYEAAIDQEDETLRIEEEEEEDKASRKRSGIPSSQASSVTHVVAPDASDALGVPAAETKETTEALQDGSAHSGSGKQSRVTHQASGGNAVLIAAGESQRRVRRQSTMASALAEGTVLEPYGPEPIRWVFLLVQSDVFQGFITLLIVLNTITLSMEHHNMSANERAFQDTANATFTIAFTIEMGLKLIGLGPRQYAKDFFNVFDFVIVTISLVELVMDAEGGGTGLGALRTFRLMRVFKLARSWKNLRKLLHTILLSILDVTNAAILLVIIMFIFTLLGMQLFGGQWTANHFCDDPEDYEGCLEETPRANFDSFAWGFVTVFQVLTGENWNEVMYIGKRVNGEIAWVYFIALNIVGTYMVLNLFLAILLARFEADDQVEALEEAAETLRQESKRRLQARASGASITPAMPQSSESTMKKDAKPVGVHADPQFASTGRRISSQTLRRTSSQRDDDCFDGDDVEARPPNPNKMTMHPTARAFFLLPPDNWFRQACFKLVNSGKFDNFILLLIGISTVLLAAEEPYVSECKETTCKGFFSFLYVMDIVLNVLFIIEMVLKMIALGVLFHKHSYLRSGWNVLDFGIVLVSISSLVLGGDKAMKALKSLRSLRALRPLRVISRSPGMRLVVNAIIAAIPAIANVSVVVLLFMLIFAIIGVQSFAGGLNSCNDPSLQGPTVNKSMCLADETWTPTLSDCGVLATDSLIEQCMRCGENGCNGTEFEFPRIWGPHGGRFNTYNFDNVGQSLLVVFEVVSGEMWPDMMYAAMDVVGPDQPMLAWPHRENGSVAIWFILVILVCSFLMINVFVGVIIDNFNDMKEKQNGSGLLTEEQKLWLATIKKTMQEKPKKLTSPPKDKLRLKVWKLVTSRRFEFVIMSFILLNTFMMMLQSESISGTLLTVTKSLNWVFLAIFTIEASLKLYAHRLAYFKSGWNCFDFSLVIFGYLGLMGGLGPLASLLRIFRVARIFRLVRTSPGLLAIFRTLVFSIPAILNVGGIFLLLILIYAILGMNLFANIKHGDLLNSDANFNGFFVSVSTLFRVSTGESFNGIMHDCMIEEPYCSEDAGNCGYPIFAPIYFCSFFVFSSYTLLSMITAIILDQFADQGAAAASTVREEHIEAFKEEWSKLDPKGTMLIREELLIKLVSHVPYPLGVRNTPRSVACGLSVRKLANALIRSLDVPTIHGSVAFSDVLTELTSKAMPEISIPEDNKLVQKLLGRKENNQAKMLRKMGTSREHILYNAAQVNAIMLLQSAMRGFIYRTKLAELMQLPEETKLESVVSQDEGTGVRNDDPSPAQDLVDQDEQKEKESAAEFSSQ